jgi:pimeloyl-ACP methyl ester carboxylesterase
MKNILQYGLICCIALLAGCSGSDDGGVRITGPEVTAGPGRVYPISEVSFLSNDGVRISALYGVSASADDRLPAVVLLHDLGGDKSEWLSTTDLFIDLLERGYAVVAIDMRGHGQTPLPDSRQVLLIEDLENSFLDVHGTLNWLLSQRAIDPNRIALIGNGSGGNVAFVSSGVFPQQVKTSISLSPGLWEASSLSPLVIGRGLTPFSPRSVLYLVGALDELQGPDIVLSYADFARNLEAATAQPKSLRVFQNSSAHGIDLINEVPEAKDLLFLWLENNL